MNFTIGATWPISNFMLIGSSAVPVSGSSPNPETDSLPLPYGGKRQSCRQFPGVAAKHSAGVSRQGCSAARFQEKLRHRQEFRHPVQRAGELAVMVDQRILATCRPQMHHRLEPTQDRVLDSRLADFQHRRRVSTCAAFDDLVLDGVELYRTAGVSAKYYITE
jgi:hypothetical protein